MAKFPYDPQRKLDIISMGRVAVDFYAEQIGSPLEDVQTFQKYLGGCAGNIAVGCARQGLKSVMFSCVGKDAMGQFLKKNLHKEGVDIRLLQESDQHLTGLVVLGVNPPDRFPLIFYRENCADMQLKPEHCSADIFAQSKSLLVTGTGFSTESMRNTSFHALKMAKQCKTAVIFDLDFRPVLWNLLPQGDGETRYQSCQTVSNHYREVLPYCDLIIGTEEEVLIASGASSLDQAITHIRDLTKAPIVLKTGAQGCNIYVEDINNPIISQGFPVDVLNVLGAGDAFMSGLLRGWLQEEDWQTCARYANACGAIVVSRHGCAPAIPSFEEMQFFMANFATDYEILTSPKLQLQHRHVTLGQAKNQPLQILAFDHRWQFEQSCDEAKRDRSLINRFKQQIFAGFNLARQQNNNSAMAILVDPIYGAGVLKLATDANLPIGVPIEAAGSMPTQWIDELPLYQQLLERPAAWFVKVLWQFHPDMPKEIQQTQFKQLNELAQTCDRLERRLMLELIIPSEFDYTPTALQAVMETVYQHNIYPYWWKVAGFDQAQDWQPIVDLLNQYDESARIILLGGSTKDLSTYQAQFRAVKESGKAGGFAVGRSVFWPLWQAVLSDEISLDHVAEKIAENYLSLIKCWQQQEEKSYV